MVIETATTSAPADPWSPCRRHIMDLLFAIPVRIQARAHWRCTPAVWGLITADPELKSNWTEHRAGHRDDRTLFDIAVRLDGRGNDIIELIIPADCRPEG